LKNIHTSKNVCSLIGVCSASKAFSTMRRRNALSLSGGCFGSPTGCITPLPFRTLFTPIALATDVNEVISTVAIPNLSSSLLSAAPQRVPEPQVPVAITALTLASFSSLAIS
jgi:hypothetical protein